MSIKYLHVIQNKHFIHSLENLIGNDVGHRILVCGDPYTDPDGNPVTYDQVVNLAETSHVLFVHFLEYKKASLINDMLPGTRIVWFFWGGDGYHLGKFTNRFLLPKTKKLRYILSLKHFWSGGWKDLAKMVLGPLTDYLPPNKTVLEAIQKVDVVVPVIPQDYYNLKEQYNVPGEMFHLNYVNRDHFLSQPDQTPAGENHNILLGNSARYSNNHLEFIDQIKTLNFKNRQIIIPLSYGDEYYGSHIGRYARNALGDRVKILDQLLPLDEYRKLFNTCDTIIMNQCRQQGLGNILIALLYEKTIYLNPVSGLYQFLVDRGFNVLKIVDYEVGKTLTAVERKHNAKLMERLFSPDLQRQKFNRLLDRIDQFGSE